MQPSGEIQQPDYHYEYNDKYCQQVARGGAVGDRPLGLSMRPTIEVSDFYHPSPLPQHTPPQSSYHQTSRTPITISQFPYAQSSLEHKPFTAHPQQPSDYRFQTTPEANPEPIERSCDICQYPDPILVAPNCNHTFHSRCVHVWPMDACPACCAPLDQVSISPSIDMLARPEPRSGKWTRPEEKYIDEILREFDRQALPLAHGTPIRLVLAKLLNCSTMRLSKKFQKNALGKRTFRVAKPGKGEKALQFDPIDHVRRQRELSRLEQIFRQELVDQFRRENNTEDGAFFEAQNLRIAVQQFWVSNLLKFAVLVGQPVTGLDVSDAKKRKRALQLLRNGQFDELLSWHQHHPLSPANTASITPMPLVPGASSSDNRAVSTSWSTSTVVYSSSMLEQQQVNGSSIPVQLQQSDRPVKKLRTPEANVEVGRFGLLMDQSGAYPQYRRITSLGSSVLSIDYNEQFVRPAGYSPISEAKTGRQIGAGYAIVLQQQQQKQQMLPGLMGLDGIVHDHRNGLEQATVTRAGDACDSSQMAPWADLIENMSSVVNASAASSSSHDISQSNDSPMHSWPSIHMV
ncbi:hypothetical protein PsorP6_002446 [Peronosclerospora sorghi]|uniref:Uncharacterized protein n=1 Tax=Peronosclerospora sorghi TaxID=230839 RepID=A0ACC0WRY2_9STRA|nr:hypothetical protein PsorP6_002446 [Peronosclerospora sorghi]